MKKAVKPKQSPSAADSHLEKTPAEVLVSAEMFRQVFEKGLIGLIVVQPDLKILRANRAFCSMLGYAPEEVIGRSILDFTYPEDVTVSNQAGEALFGNNAPAFHMEKRYLRRDGKVVWASVAIFLISDSQGRPSCSIGTVEDITARKRVETRLRRINEAAVALGEDSARNMEIILSTCGELLEADSAFYNTIDEEGMLYARGKWQAPPGFKERDLPDGHVCYDVIRSPGDGFLLIRNLDKSPYARTDPNIAACGLKTYLGVAVQARGRILGSLCLVFKRDFEPDESDKRLLGVIARALRVEEERRKAVEEIQKREEHIRGIASGGDFVLWSTDARGVFTFSDGLALKKIGLRPGQVVGRSVFELYQDYGLIVDNVRTALTGAFRSFEVEMDGVDFQMNLTPLRDRFGKVLGVVGVAIDLSERRRAEKELAQRALELARSNRELEQFAYIASHDLQEPLRMISNFSEALVQRYGGLLEETGKKYLERIRVAVQHMKEFVDDLLEFSRVGRQGKELQTVECREVLAKVLNSLQVAIQEKSAIINIDPLPRLQADFTQLVALFQNLISNGLKFQKPGAVPRLQVSAQERPGEWLFSVGDNGIGIEPRYLKSVFEIFHRLHSKEKYPGTGLGLALCKKVVERHGGAIWAESVPDQGTLFCFTLPKNPVAEGRTRAAEAKPGG